LRCLRSTRQRWFNLEEAAGMFAGVDTHKDTLAFAVVDPGGRPVVVCELPNDPDGYDRLGRLIHRHQVIRVGIEGSTNFGWPASMHLIDTGVDVVEVPPLMTSRERRGHPGHGKTDPVDAVAIARITAREPNLPPVRPMTGLPAELRALNEYRDQLIAERTATANRIHVDLGWIRPGYQHRIPRLTSTVHLREALELLTGEETVRADLTRRPIHRWLQITAELFARQALSFRRVGNSSFMASMPATLMAGTSIPSSTPSSSLNDPAGNRFVVSCPTTSRVLTKEFSQVMTGVS
jgi:transposase